MHVAMEVAGGRRKPSGRDRLSNLPDCLLNAILSQIRSRQAVQTCALSRRWTHLWRAVSCIHIDSADFSNQERRHVEEEEAVAKLEDFADNLLLRRGLSASSSPEAPLDAMRLRVHGGSPRGDTNVGRWIRRGLKLSPVALEVSGGKGDPINLTCIPCVSGGGARRLTRLRLDNVVLQRDLEDLLGPGGLPVLEDLEIINAAIVFEIWRIAFEIWRIASDTLMSLTVVGASSRYPAGRRNVHITAPRLASLRLEFPLANIHFDILEAPACLAQASIRLLDGDDDGDDDDDSYDPDDKISYLCALLGSLSSVTSLHLSGFQETLLLDEMLDRVACSRSSMLLFPNLTSLALEDCDLGENLQSVWRFLDSTPAISRLTLYNCEWQHSYDSWVRDREKDLEVTILALNLVQTISGDATVS